MNANWRTANIRAEDYERLLQIKDARFKAWKIAELLAYMIELLEQKTEETK